MKYISFIPPKCNIIEVKKRVWSPRAFIFKITRNDGKEFEVLGISYNYKENLLTIRINKERLPIILEIEKEFLILK